MSETQKGSPCHEGNDLNDWHYLEPEECNDSADSMMSDNDEDEASVELERGDSINVDDISIQNPSIELGGKNEEREMGFVPVNIDVANEDGPNYIRNRASVSFERMENLAVPCRKRVPTLNSGAESSDFVTLNPDDRTTDSSMGHPPPFLTKDDFPEVQGHVASDDEAPSGCHDLYVGVKEVRCSKKQNLESEADASVRGASKNEEYEDGYQSECSSSLAFQPEDGGSPHRVSPNDTRQGSRNREENSLLDQLLGPRLFLVLLVALISLGLGHLIGQGKLLFDQDDAKAVADLKHTEQIESMQLKLSEQLNKFNQDLQAERAEWRTQLENANTMLSKMKSELDFKQSEHNQNPKQHSDGAERPIDTDDHQSKMEEILNKYSLSSDDQNSIKMILEQKAKAAEKEDNNQKAEGSAPNIVKQMSESLNSTKKFLFKYLGEFQNTFKNLNLTSNSAEKIINSSKESILNVSNVLSMTELVGNTVFEILSDKMAKISEVKQNLTLQQVEDFANEQAQATVSKLNNVVSKTVDKMSTVKNEIASNKHVQKLKKQVDKTVSKFIKGAVNQWNIFANSFNSRGDNHVETEPDFETGETLGQKRGEDRSFTKKQKNEQRRKGKRNF